MFDSMNAQSELNQRDRRHSDEPASSKKELIDSNSDDTKSTGTIDSDSKSIGKHINKISETLIRV